MEMKMDEKLVIEELRSVRAICASWMRAIETAMEDKEGGYDVNVVNMQRELTLCSAKIEAIIAGIR